MSFSEIMSTPNLDATTTATPPYPLQGSCPCRTIRYQILRQPLITHCCHCTSCQRETGSAFAINVMIEAGNVEILSETQPIQVDTPSESGMGQVIARYYSPFFYPFAFPSLSPSSTFSLDNLPLYPSLNPFPIPQTSNP